MRISYNSPVVLTYSLMCVIVYIINISTGGTLSHIFALRPIQFLQNPLDFSGVLLYTIGHANLEHLSGNLTFLLLLGPILEEKYKSSWLLLMMLVTALVTPVLHMFLFPAILMGASGIVFMLIILASFVNVKEGSIPLTFLIILVLFISKEVYNSFQEDNISQFAHIIGGICGSIFGFSLKPKHTARKGVNEDIA